MLGTCITSSHRMARLHHSQSMQLLPVSTTDKRPFHHRDMCTTTEGRLFHAIEMSVSIERHYPRRCARPVDHLSLLLVL